jgi:hypothetical protein
MRGQKTEHGGRRREEKDAQSIGGQPRNDDEADHMEEPERSPSFLTARELLAQDPEKGGQKAGDKELPRGAQKRTHKLLSDDDEPITGKD